jgi:hypothetical protein
VFLTAQVFKKGAPQRCGRRRLELPCSIPVEGMHGSAIMREAPMACQQANWPVMLPLSRREHFDQIVEARLAPRLAGPKCQFFVSSRVNLART